MIRLFGCETTISDLKFAIWQTAIFFLAFVIPMLAQAMAHNTSDVPNFTAFALLLEGVLFAGLLSTSMFAFGLDARALSSSDNAFPVRLALAILAGGVLIAVAFHLLPIFTRGSAILPASLALAFAGILATRRLTQWLVRSGGSRTRAIILGAGESALKIQSVMTLAQAPRYELVGHYDPGSGTHAVALGNSKFLDQTRPLDALASENSVGEIVVALDDRRGALPIDDLLRAKLSGIRVTDLVTFFERECSTIKFEYLHPSWIVFSSDFRLGAGKRIAKRVFDVTAALAVLTITAPLLLLVTLASLIESRGRDPILYHQERVGYRGRIFRLHKFRSMAVDAEGDGKVRWATAGDDRVTRVGRVLRRYRLDELPQLFNILAGDMSLVGPRPERPEFVQGLTESIPYYGERHCVKPGLAGWAQLMYPYGASIDDAKRKLEYDLYYIKHASVVWDFMILIRTVEIVLLGKGVR